MNLIVSKKKINKPKQFSKSLITNDDEEPPPINLILESSKINKSETISLSEHSKIFYNKFFPNSTEKDWLNWTWQIKNSFTTVEQLSHIIDLLPDEIQNIINKNDSLPIRITPHYASILYNKEDSHPLRKCVIPVIDEYLINSVEASDPLCETEDSPVPNLIHRYPDRVLFLVTGFCSTYCRYCTRSHMVAKDDKVHFGIEHLEKALNYIEQNSQIRDVLLSGGDPLTMSDNFIDYILSRLRAIPHVEFIRIGTKIPVVLPQRITKKLVSILKKYHPLWMSIHFTHPDEITPEVSEACKRLADAGIPLGSQTVLLKDINDNIDTMKELFHKLLINRVRPYYLYQCDPILGSGHFRTSIKTGLDIIHGLRGYTSGYAVPSYVIDAPGGGGKIPILPEYFLGYDENQNAILKNFENKIFKYPDIVK